MAAQACIQGASCALSQYARSACPFLVFPKRVLSGALGRDILNEARAILPPTCLVLYGSAARKDENDDYKM